MPKSLKSDAEIASALKWYASRVLAGRNPVTVAADVVIRGRRARKSAVRIPATLAAALAIALILGATTAMFLGQAGSSPATADVNGLTYGVAAVRSLHISEADLRAYGELGRFDSGLQIRGTTAYAIRGVDPRDALVVPLRAGAQDEGGPLGDYVLLVRGSYAALCDFFDPASNATPTECR